MRLFTNTPALPDSLNHVPVERDESKWDNIDENKTPFTTATTPYLGWKARLSQVPINRWTILILLVLVRVLIMLSSLDDDLGSAKEKALLACTKVEDIGSAMASMPHYLSVGVNDLTASSITRVVQGLIAVLDIITYGLQGLIVFVIDMVIGTYACLISALIHGGLDAAMDTIEGATKLLNKAVDGIADDVEGTVNTFQKSLTSVTNWINDVVDNDLFGKIGIDPPTIPSLNISADIKDLRNVNIDTSSLLAGLKDLNETIPDFQDVRNFTRMAVEIPFKEIREAIDASLGNWTMDRDVFPVTKKQALTFCSDNTKLQEFFESLYEMAAGAKKILLGVLITGAIAAMIPMYILERRRWKRQQMHAKLIDDNTYNAMDVIYIASRPMTANVGIKMAGKLTKNKHRGVLIRWAWAYATTLPAIFLLSLAIAGFFSCLCQYLILKGVESKVPELAQQVGDFAGDVVNSLQNASVQWATDANAVILNEQNDINNDMLSWVDKGTTAVNDTINTFLEEMNGALVTVFNDTMLWEPVNKIIFCVVTSKVLAIQAGITWVHDQAQVQFPLLANDTFSLGAAKSIDEDSDLTSFLASPSSVTTDEITGAVEKVVDRIYNNIITELFISTGILLVYVIVVLIGVLAATARMLGSGDKDTSQSFVTNPNEVGPPGLASSNPFDEKNVAIRSSRGHRPTLSQGHNPPSQYGDLSDNHN